MANSGSNPAAVARRRSPLPPFALFLNFEKMIELKGKYNKDCKIFIDEIEDGAVSLIQSILDNEISADVPVRIMPDTHVGVDIVIGFTMPVTTMLNPNHIGVDIGCSVTSHKLSKRFEAEEFPKLDKAIRKAVPMGHDIKKKGWFRDWWVSPFFEEANRKLALFNAEWGKRYGESKPAINVDREYITKLCKRVGISEGMFYLSVGTLGGGNHFIEIGESSADGSHFLTIHSGSRNFGLKVCKYHARKMESNKSLPREYHDEFNHIVEHTQPKSDIQKRLAELNRRYKTGGVQYLLQGDDMYDYLADMVIAQTYAEFNHRVMSESIFAAIRNGYEAVDTVHSMHNFIDTQDWIIRKGAIRAYEGERMVIPFNMRDGLLICEGKGNADWNFSAPHGAGRILARNQAKRLLDMDEFSKEMTGIYSTSVCESTLDESPMAYKDKNVIIEAIRDTAVILDTVRPILNIKAR